MPSKHPIEIANLAKVEEAISFCVMQGRSLRLSLIQGLHKTLMQGVPEEPGHPLKPGELRNATDQLKVYEVRHLTDYVSPAWRVRQDLITLLEDTENGRLPGDNSTELAARFHYRFVRIHPFCDGNGRMARALSMFLLAREDPDVLLFEKPINAILLEHREDYVGTLEYCDSLYIGFAEEDMSEEDKLKACEKPFLFFYLKAVSIAMYEQAIRLKKQLVDDDVLSVESIGPLPSSLDLSLATIKSELRKVG